MKVIKTHTGKIYVDSDKQLEFFNSSTFEEFYKIASTLSTRSLNIDSNSVQFCGLYK